MPEKFSGEQSHTDSRLASLEEKIDKLVNSIHELVTQMAVKQQTEQMLSERVKKVEEENDVLQGRVYILELENERGKPFRELGMKALYALVGLITVAIAVAIGVKK